MFADAEVDGLRVSVFGGPVLGEGDRAYRGVRIPREYWKVIVHTEHGRLRASAFVLTQNLDRLEVLELDEFRVYQVTLGEVEERCHLLFPAALRAAQTPVAPESLEEREPLADLADIRWS